MCKGGPALGIDKQSRIERWGVADEEQLRAAVATNNLVWLDVRTDAEIEAKPLPEALRIRKCHVTMFSAAKLEREAPTLLPSKTDDILVFCGIGGRAAVAVKCLKGLGYTGEITNAGGVSDIEQTIPEVLAAAAKTGAKKSGTSSCVTL